MTRRVFLLVAVGGTVHAAAGSAVAQPAARLPRVGVLHIRNPRESPGVKAFLEALRELQYVDGHSVVVEMRGAAGKIERLPALAAELVRLRPNIIVTGDPTSTAAAQRATRDIPIVMAVSTDPVAAGFVTTLARPGGNITGLSILAPELSGKRLELLREAVPGLSRVAVLAVPQAQHHPQLMRETEQAAQALGVAVVPMHVGGRHDLDKAFQTAAHGRVGALLALQAAEFAALGREIAALGLKFRLPTMTAEDDFAEAGGLLKYGASTGELWRRAAGYVDRILKGARPGDLPVEQPTKVELVINLATARALGLTLPASRLLRADKIVE